MMFFVCPSNFAQKIACIDFRNRGRLFVYSNKRKSVAVQSFQVSMNLTGISADDKLLIKKLRDELHEELRLVPAYDDDYSLLRWIVGWDRKLG